MSSEEGRYKFNSTQSDGLMSVMLRQAVSDACICVIVGKMHRLMCSYMRMCSVVDCTMYCIAELAKIDLEHWLIFA